MAILHGSWLLQPPEQTTAPSPESPQPQRQAPHQGYFCLWGEAWRRVDPITLQPTDAPAPYPFAMSREELLDWLRSLHQVRQITGAIETLPLETAVTSSKAPPSPTSPLASLSELGVAERWQTVYLTVPTRVLGSPLHSGDAEAHESEESNADNAITVLAQHSAAVVSQPDRPADTDLASSLALFPWRVEGIRLTPLEALHFLNALPLAALPEGESFVGGDLRFWSHVARWSLDLLARSKFLPGLRSHGETGTPFWQVLLDSEVDQARLRQFVKRMPLACRSYSTSPNRPTAVITTLVEGHLPPEQQGRLLLLGFLNSIVDAQVSRVAATHALPTLPLPKDMLLREWLASLGSGQSVTGDSAKIERLNSMLTQWMAPIQQHLGQQITSFRTCFYLHPPPEGQTDWRLEYFLQAADDPDCLVSARTIWNNPVDRLSWMGRSIEQPQETLLAGLGLASRLYPVLEPSLQTSQPESCQLNPLQVYEFISSVAWRLRDSGFGVILPPSLSHQGGWANRLGLSIRADAPIAGKGLGLKSLLNFKWELTIGGQRLSKAEFDRLVALNTPLVEINGEWVELRPSDIRAAQAFFANRKDQMALSLEDALRISTGDTQIIEKLPVLSFEASGALQDLITALTKGNQSIEILPTPQGFQGELRPYQQRGMSWLRFLQRWGLGACLADDMGLGKTPQFIALLLHLKEESLIEKPTLLICPTSVLGNWEREVKRFAPSLKVLVHHGDKRSQGKAFAKAVEGMDLVLTSYALVYRDEDELKSVDWQGVVLDEAQNIKNPEAKQSQVVRQLTADFRIALTGTPVENRLSELWSILDFLNPGYLGPRNFFQRRFAVPIERYGDTDSLRTLRSLVQPFILRRLKTDRDIIQDLPDKQEMTVFCGLTAEQAALYQHLVDESLVAIESAEGIQRRGMILALLTKLKQVCNHPELLKLAGESETSTQKQASTKKRSSQPWMQLDAAFLGRSGKLQRLSEMLEELLAEGDRTLIFTQFAEWGKLLQGYLEQQFKREVLFLYGSSSKKQREAMIDRFQNDPQGPRIFILSLKAGGVGLNLTRANHVFHFDRWWNPAVENQATDRAFRIGQTRNVQVHKFVCTGTLEERIHELIESKKALAEQIVGAGEHWLTELDTDQLRNLLLLDRSAIIDE